LAKTTKSGNINEKLLVKCKDNFATSTEARQRELKIKKNHALKKSLISGLK
jgi:hypothetical protein